MQEKRCRLCARMLPITDYSIATHGRHKGDIKKVCDLCSRKGKEYKAKHKTDKKPKPSITLCNAYSDYIFC